MRPALPALALLLALSGCTAATGAAPETAAVQPEPTIAAITLTDAERVARAEAAVLAVLPDAPIWKGMTIQGVVVNISEICVDRTWAPGGGVDSAGGNAGYVVVVFPAISLGEPQEGTCATYAPQPATIPTEVEVPSALADDPGLLVSSTFGDKWPLTVPYAIVHCESRSSPGRSLQLATLEAPDGETYAVNGTAKSHGDYADIDPIWAPDPDVSGLKISMSPVTDAALALCP
jgi:hypothetical protein